MKIAYNWLKEFITVDKSAEEVAEILTDIGLEVEKIIYPGDEDKNWEGVIVGKVLEVVCHPNADKLFLTKVDLGDGEPVQIVCGADNVRAGQKVPVATIGTKLKIGDKEIKIKKGKIRGEVSYGMICAEDELGISDNHDGIMVLGGDAPVGKPLKEVIKNDENPVFEIGLTPNRMDAMSHFGVARDLKAKLKFEGENVKFIPRSVGAFLVENRVRPVHVDVQDKNKCPHYMGITIQHVKVEPSPEWLQKKLLSIGLKPINNIVDITNYVLHDIGQPLHAFDADKISGNQIIVRRARPGEKIVALDEKEYTLDEDDLVIADADKPLAIAGVMGGLESSINENTQNIFLESAWFDPVTVRRTSKRLGLATDSSFRFERGVDPEMVEFAMKRAASLIKELIPEALITEPVDEELKKFEPPVILLHYDYIYRMIGEKIARDQIKQILSLLDFKLISDSEESLTVESPLYRFDVTRPADVIEEILRIYGYNRVKLPEKMTFSVAHEEPVEDFMVEKEVASMLTHGGYTETMSVSMTSEKEEETFTHVKQDVYVELVNPISKEYTRMRQSLLLSGLENIRFNVFRQRDDLAFFEFGKTYQKKSQGKYVENKRLAMFLTGQLFPETWLNLPVSGFFMLKGKVTQILERFNIAYEEKPSTHPDFDEALDIIVENKVLVTLGSIKNEISRSMDIKKPVYAADWDWDLFLQEAKKLKSFEVWEIPKFPSVRRDLALLADKDVLYADIRDVALETEKKFLEKVWLFDVYEGDKIPAGKKSYAIAFVFRSPDKTLNDKQVDKMVQKIYRKLEEKFGVELRK